MRKKLIAANWKMYKTPDQTRDFFRDFLPLVSATDRDEIVVCPPDIDLAAALESAKGSNVAIGGQNVHWKSEGAFTGETSAAMLLALGVTHVIIGHSERRQYFGETDDTVNLRLKAALEAGLTPICCVGEVLQEREAGLTDDVLRRQCVRAFHAVSAKKAANLVVAYEPVWAIGTGKTATPELAAEAHAVIRREATRNIWRRFRHEAAHSLWRIGKAGQCLSPDGAGGNRWRAGGRGVARSEIVCGDCEVLMSSGAALLW